ncbi:MAG: DUF5305 family protein [Halobacteriaceae archaeon]
MSELDRSVRVRAFLDSRFLLVVLVLCLTTALLGWWTYQVHAVPDIERQERVVEEWSASTSYNHSAVIINDSLPFEKGEVVRNRPIYYTNLSTELDGVYRYEYAADRGDLRVTTETFLLIRAGELQDQRVVETFWEVSRPLASVRTQSLEPGESHRVKFAVDVRDVLETIATVEQQVGAQKGLVDVRVRSVSMVNGTVEGDSVSQRHTSDMVMVVEPATFRVIQSDTMNRTYDTRMTREVVVEPSPLEAAGSIGSFAFATAALLALVVDRSVLGYVELDEKERELLRVERERERFAEWITTGTFPAEREYEEMVLVDDLEGLVDVAIDTNKRVIEDQQLGVSTVLDGDHSYVYVRPDSPARDWLLHSADTTLEEFDQHDR